MLKSISYGLGYAYGKLPTPGRFYVVAGILLVLAWLVIPTGSLVDSEVQEPSKKLVPNEPDEKEKLARTLSFQRAVFGARVLKESMRDPDSFNLETAIVVEGTGAVCYEYRAKNGFGGTNYGRAVISADGSKFLTNTMEGFALWWNAECANKKGVDSAAALRWFVLPR